MRWTNEWTNEWTNGPNEWTDEWTDGPDGVIRVDASVPGTRVLRASRAGSRVGLGGRRGAQVGGGYVSRASRGRRPDPGARRRRVHRASRGAQPGVVEPRARPRHRQ